MSHDHKHGDHEHGKKREKKHHDTPAKAVPVDELPYRPCVGIVLLSADGLVFVGRRAGGEEQVDSAHAWQMPQGGIDGEEDPLEAAKRELYEETGVRSVSLLAETPDWVRYDLPPELVGKAWKGRYRGQIQKWFAFRFEGPDSEIDVLKPPGGHKAEFAEWRWERLARLPDLVVPFKRAVYEKVVAAFAPLVPAAHD
ncbi:RNA pyrophosphohydrolase [Segnochrobactrum spirostomi]|uniref:RNA pyrophosphohydrolase n=1 Tax=Segnochrobactrum spirostomi TaxID=2608987 RepID=A0A6A7Y7A6_9HYPH|nr:RNA pyrophosphohydrolase [Segnochrobactrum spirostomi]MQT14197.1 RNA pyrophosphohydrolase [Segnochrobactrum spirostomi]